MISSCIKRILPNTRVDESALESFLIRIRSSAENFYREDGNNLLAAYTDDLPFSSKKQCVLVAWAGSGMGMVFFREWISWVKARKSIRVACYTPMFDDDRLEGVLARYGFKRHGGMFVWER